MAQIETPQGFRLPWPGDKAHADKASAEAASDAPVAEAPPAIDPTPAEEVETPVMVDTTTTTDEVATPEQTVPNAPATGRKPTKIMADLSRAMQTAAVSSREEIMGRFSADAKAVVEEIQVAATGEGADLRRRADDDVAAVREWSKGEIARIREEAEARIAVRKSDLDGEMDAHAGVVEARVQRVAATVESFESEMAAFFERLLAEDDPARIASMAETMPEPPDLAGVAASIAVPTFEPFDPVPPLNGSWPHGSSTDQAPVAHDTDVEPEAQATEAQPGADFAAAEAEAATLAESLAEADAALSAVAQKTHESPDEEPSTTEETSTEEAPMSSDRTTTRVSVVGLVSVASIASFKRSLGRATGVTGIRVASGPDGEFVFTVEHDPGLALGGTIVAMPGFDARVIGETDGALDITAHDPDPDA